MVEIYPKCLSRSFSGKVLNRLETGWAEVFKILHQIGEGVISEWSECSATCGFDAIRTRTISYPKCGVSETVVEKDLCKNLKSCIKLPFGGTDANSSEWVENDLTRSTYFN